MLIAEKQIIHLITISC